MVTDQTDSTKVDLISTNRKCHLSLELLNSIQCSQTYRTNLQLRGKGQLESGVDMCTLLYFKWITKKGPTVQQNSAQCYVTWMGGESGGEWTHVYAYG